jgi:molecular chaperone Hsp33
VTASAANGTVSLVAGITTRVVREAQQRHRLAPTASAAVGRLITGAGLLGASLGSRERLTLQIKGDGPIGSIVADSWNAGTGSVAARAYARYPAADIPLNERGKFDVAGVIGKGQLQVTKSYELGQPYNGIVPLETGEVGDDIAAYLANSQQITIAALEHNAREMPPVTQQIVDGADGEALLAAVTRSLDLNVFGSFAIAFDCRCTREKVESALLGLGRDELKKIASEQPHTEATCEFCKRRYVLSSSEVDALVSRLDARG